MPQDGLREKTGEELPQFRSVALVAVGANEAFGGNPPEHNVSSAIERLAARAGVIRAASPLYATPAFPAGAGPDFVNAAFALETTLGAEELLAAMHEIEAEFGRRRSVRWGPRTLDLDLLALGDLVLPDLQTHDEWVELPLAAQRERVPDRLILPHPRLAERAFVLVPLADVAPDWRHPVSGRSVGEMLDALPVCAKAEVRRLTFA